MELYDTEEQQVEAIKNWWQENGKTVVIGSVLAIAAVLGWNYYQYAQKQSQEAASTAYSTMLTSLNEKGIDASSDVQGFINRHDKSQYAVLAAMQLAKSFVEAKELEKAMTQLQWALKHTDDAVMKPLLTYRIARIQAEQGQYDVALQSLNRIQADPWKGRVAELKGDIEVRRGNKEAAYVAYTEAQQAKDSSQTLQMKLDDLAK